MPSFNHSAGSSAAASSRSAPAKAEPIAHSSGDLRAAAHHAAANGAAPPAPSPLVLLNQIDTWLMEVGYDGAHPWRVAINHTLVDHGQPGAAVAGEAPHQVALCGLAEGLTANGVAVAGSQSYSSGNHPEYVALPLHLVRTAYDACTQLQSLIYLLSRTLGSEEDIDETLDACVGLAYGALEISGGVMFVLGGDHPKNEDIARWSCGQAMHWPAWVHAAKRAEGAA